MAGGCCAGEDRKRANCCEVGERGQILDHAAYEQAICCASLILIKPLGLGDDAFVNHRIRRGHNRGRAGGVAKKMRLCRHHELFGARILHPLDKGMRV